MQILVLQHVSFEGPAAIQAWANSHQHTIQNIDCSTTLTLPIIDSFDCLIIMGGPMSVNDELPWMQAELEFIRQCIQADKYVIGICLGAQMIAKTMGAEILKNQFREIGWHPVAKNIDGDAINIDNGENKTHWANNIFPAVFTPLHWHGDTFTLPAKAKRILSSKGCDNQAFILGRRTLGLQFHLEFDTSTAMRVAAACKGELTEGGPYVQTATCIIKDTEKFEAANTLLFHLLDALELDHLNKIRKD